MSDHEVNIKILMDILMKRGVVRGRAERNHILAEMTEEVAELVLADNRNQARALTLDGLRSVSRYEEFVAFTEDLIAAGVLSRADDAIPTRDELLASPHRERGLPRPLLAVLLGHTKMYAFEMVMQTSFPESEAGRPFLVEYFPQRLQREFADHFEEHPLRREIVATAAVNHVINCAGVTFLVADDGGRPVRDRRGHRRLLRGGPLVGRPFAARASAGRAAGSGVSGPGRAGRGPGVRHPRRPGGQVRATRARPWSRCGRGSSWRDGRYGRGQLDASSRRASSRPP